MRPMETWLHALHFSMDKESPHALFAILRGSNRNEDLTVPVVNHAKGFVQRLFEGRESKIALYLYYRLLHGILQRFVVVDNDDTKATGSPIVSVIRKSMMQRLRNSHFHSALLCCAAEMVAHAYHGKMYPWATQRANRMCFSVDLWMVTVHILDAQHILDLPITVISFLQEIQQCVMRDDCFMRHSSVYLYLLEGGGCLHLPGETHMIEQFLQEFAGLVLDHMKDLADRVAAEMNIDEVSLPVFVDRCMDLVDLVLFHHLYLFFERSIFVPILCCAYCVGKIGKTQISFKLLTHECAARFPTIQLSSFGLVRMSNPTDASTTVQHGTIWQFYNEIFLSTCKDEIHEIFQSTENADRSD